MDENGPVPIDQEIEMHFGEKLTFADHSWTRYTADDHLNYEAVNAAWSERTTEWYMPLDWHNYVDAGIFTSEYSLWFRYETMVYQAVLNVGINEFGPVNEVEMLFMLSTLIMSSLLNALIFGDVAVLISVLSKSSQNYQDTLDRANNIMNLIRIDNE